METTMAKKSASKDQHKPHRLIRIPMELYDRLRQAAADNRRPVSWEIRIMLEDAVTVHEEKREQ